MSVVNAKNFGSKLSGVVRSGKSMRANIQELTLFACVFYVDPANSGNADFLNRIFVALRDLKSMNHKLWVTAVEDTVNVKLRGKAGEERFGKAQRGVEPSFVDAPVLTTGVNWWDHGRDVAPKDLDMLKSLKQLATQIEKTQGEKATKKLAEGQECAVSLVLRALAAAEAQAERAIEDHKRELACVAQEAAEAAEAERIEALPMESPEEAALRNAATQH